MAFLWNNILFLKGSKDTFGLTMEAKYVTALQYVHIQQLWAVFSWRQNKTQTLVWPIPVQEKPQAWEASETQKVDQIIKAVHFNSRAESHEIRHKNQKPSNCFERIKIFRSQFGQCAEQTENVAEDLGKFRKNQRRRSKKSVKFYPLVIELSKGWKKDKLDGKPSKTRHSHT